MVRQLIFGSIILLAGGFILTTCNNDYFELDRLSDEIEVKPELVAPLIHGSMSMFSIMELFDTVEYIDTFNTGLIYIAYTDTILSVDVDTAIELPPLKAAEFYLESDTDVPVMLPVPVGDTFYLPQRTQVIDFVLEGNDRLDEILVKGGAMVLDLVSTFKHDGVLTITSEEIRDNFGDAFSKSMLMVDPSGDPSGIYQNTVICPSDSFLLNPVFRNDSNLIFMDFDLALINSGNPINPDDSCTIQSNLDTATFYSVFGFIDTRDLIDASGSVDIPLWSDNPDLASLEFADPRIEFTTDNSIGVPFEVDLDSVIATGGDGAEVTLTLDGGNTLEFLAPGMDQIGENVTTHNPIDNTNSNIQEFLGVAPSSVSYSISGRTSTTNGETTHFLLDESKLNLSLEFLLPLDFRSTGFALTDTMDFELAEEGVDTSRIKNAEVTVTTINQLPIELELQVLLLDEAYVVVDSIFNDNTPILGASIVDSDGEFIQETEETNTVEFPAEKLGKLDRVSYMQVKARIITSDNGGTFVKLYSHYTLKYHVSMLAKFRINTREL